MAPEEGDGEDEEDRHEEEASGEAEEDENGGTAEEEAEGTEESESNIKEGKSKQVESEQLSDYAKSQQEIILQLQDQLKKQKAKMEQQDEELAGVKDANKKLVATVKDVEKKKTTIAHGSQYMENTQKHKEEVQAELAEALRMASAKADDDLEITMKAFRTNLFNVQQKLLGLFALNLKPAPHKDVNRLTMDRFEALTVFVCEMVFAIFNELTDSVESHEKKNPLFRSRLWEINKQVRAIFSSYDFVTSPHPMTNKDEDPAVLSRARSARFKKDASDSPLEANDAFFYRRCPKSGPLLSTVLESRKAARVQWEMAALKNGTTAASEGASAKRQRVGAKGQNRLAANGKPFNDL